MMAGPKSTAPMRTSHCRLAGELAVRLGLREDIPPALLQMFERWDGRGDPGAASGEEIVPAVRIVHVSDTAELYHREAGVAAAVEMAKTRRGTHFDLRSSTCSARTRPSCSRRSTLRPAGTSWRPSPRWARRCPASG